MAEWGHRRQRAACLSPQLVHLTPKLTQPPQQRLTQHGARCRINWLFSGLVGLCASGNTGGPLCLSVYTILQPPAFVLGDPELRVQLVDDKTVRRSRGLQHLSPLGRLTARLHLHEWTRNTSQKLEQKFCFEGVRAHAHLLLLL